MFLLLLLLFVEEKAHRTLARARLDRSAAHARQHDQAFAQLNVIGIDGLSLVEEIVQRYFTIEMRGQKSSVVVDQRALNVALLVIGVTERCDWLTVANLHHSAEERQVDHH